MLSVSWRCHPGDITKTAYTLGHLSSCVQSLLQICSCRTLPSNLALCVNPEFQYVRARDPASGKVYIVAESRLASIPGAMPKAKKGGKGADKTDTEPKGWQVSARLVRPQPKILMSATGRLSSALCCAAAPLQGW